MSTVTNMTEAQVMAMLEEAARLKLLEEQFDAKYEWTFCITPNNGIHIYGADNLMEIARILNVPVILDPYDDKEKEKMHPFLGIARFPFECWGKKWNVYAHYRDESEVVV